MADTQTPRLSEQSTTTRLASFTNRNAQDMGNTESSSNDHGIYSNAFSLGHKLAASSKGLNKKCDRSKVFRSSGLFQSSCAGPCVARTTAPIWGIPALGLSLSAAETWNSVPGRRARRLGTRLQGPRATPPARAVSLPRGGGGGSQAGDCEQVGAAAPPPRPGSTRAGGRGASRAHRPQHRAQLGRSGAAWSTGAAGRSPEPEAAAAKTSAGARVQSSPPLRHLQGLSLLPNQLAIIIFIMMMI
ncbi:uncharacterized protein LOC115894615 [Rhinopithecus roxellana]|uniref:uncharacterized protein LOC115894615 n=1 Tax=Rhinopithecus roxellana TaxID=61622 RepID=UPI0012370992|nr:uncharacterized protein LOC115894615 [Rhinopithecus roxellana]